MSAFVVTAQGFWGELMHSGAIPRASGMFSWSPRPWLNHMF
jgi:hypothetical protein